MRYCLLVCIICLLALAACSQHGQDRWRISDFGTSDPDKLIGLALQSEQDAVRDRIASYLVAKAPESPAAQAARQWLDWADSDFGNDARTRRIASLQRCVDANPKYAPCIYLLSTFGSDLKGGQEESAQLLQRTLELDPNFKARYAFIELHEKLLYELKDPHRAEALFDKYKAVYPGSYVWDYEEADAACRLKHFDMCLEALNVAKSKSDAPFIVWRNIAMLKTDPMQLYVAARDGTPIEVARSVIDDALSSRTLTAFDQRNAMEWFIAHFAFSERVHDTDLYALCYSLAESHHAENTFEYTQLIVSDNRTDRAIQKATKALPADPGRALPIEQFALGLAHLHVDGYTDTARRLLWNGIVGQYTDQDRQETLTWVARKMIDMGLSGDAEKLLRDVREEFPITQRDVIEDFDVYMKNQDVEEAQRTLQKYQKPDHYFRAAFERLMRMSQALQSRKKFANERALLVHWFQTFDERAAIEVDFPSGSAELPASAAALLDKAAALMSGPEAASYLFEVSGHTNTEEDASGTTDLSDARASNVRQALVQKGVPPERLVAKGYGPRIPLAPNDTEQGRQSNRRVEIRPIDNAASPRIAEKLPLPKSDVMLPLSGRRWAIMGQNPAYRVDLVNGTRVASFREGRPVALLHHDRYVLTRFTRDLPDGTTSAGLALYDVLTGEMIARREISNCDGCSAFAVSPAQDEIAYAMGVSLVILDGETLQTKRVGVIGRKTGQWSKGIVWTPGGQIVVSYADYDRLYVVGAATLKVERELTGVKWIHSLALSGTGLYLAGGDGDGKVHVWDAKTWSEHGTVNAGSAFPEKLAARAGSDEIAVGGEAESARRIDLKRLDVIETWPNGETLPNDLGMEGLAYSNDGTIAYRRDKSGWRAENLQSGESQSLATEDQRDQITGIVAFGSSNRLLIESSIQGNARYEIFNVKNFSREYDLTPYMAHSYFHAGPDGSIQILDGATGKWLTFDINTLSFGEPSQLGNAALLGSLKSTPKDTSFNALLNSTSLVTLSRGNKPGAPETTLHGALYSRAGQLQKTFDFNLVTEALKFGAFETSYAHAWSDSGRLLAILPWWRDGRTTPVNSKRIYFLDTKTGKTASSEGRSRPFDIDFSGEIIKIKYGFQEQSMDLASGKSSFADYGDESTLDVSGGGRLIYRDRGNLWLQHGTRLDVFKDTSDLLTADVGYFSDLGLVADVANGLLEFRDAKSLDLKFKFSLRAPGEWIAYTEDGHFVSTPNGTQNLFWNVGENYLPFESLRQRFENANLLRQTPGVAAAASVAETPDATQVAAARPASLAVEADVFSPPYSLRILGDAQRTTGLATEKLTINVTKAYPTSQPYRVQITLNGRILDADTAARGLSRIDAPCGDAATPSCAGQQVFTAELQDGLNIVEACVDYRNVCVDPHSVSILKQKSASAPGDAAASLPQLWFFGVGVSEYADKNLSLQYPRADVLGIADAFKAQEGRIYSKVNVQTMVDDQATEHSVNVAMHDFLKGATQQDIVVVFLAGHGATEDQQLYFITYDAKADDPYSGLDVGTVSNLLSKRPPGQKAIVMLDICHAGAADAVRTRGARVGSDDAIRLLATGSGTAVIMASTARELSQEGPQFGGGHGAFSWALIEGLKGAAAREGYVTVTSLEQYVERRVQEITGNNQHPTTSTDKFHDYPVAVSH